MSDRKPPHPLYEFNFNRIKAYCMQLETLEEQLDYLHFAQDEFRRRSSNNSWQLEYIELEVDSRVHIFSQAQLVELDRFLLACIDKKPINPDRGKTRFPGTLAEMVVTIDALTEINEWPREKWKTGEELLLDRRNKPVTAKQLNREYQRRNHDTSPRTDLYPLLRAASGHPRGGHWGMRLAIDLVNIVPEFRSYVVERISEDWSLDPAQAERILNNPQSEVAVLAFDWKVDFEGLASIKPDCELDDDTDSEVANADAAADPNES